MSGSADRGIGDSAAQTSLHTLVFHSLAEQIAVIDQAADIIDVNAAWCTFGIENGLARDHVWIGTNYLQALHTAHASGDIPAGQAAVGIGEVINGSREFFDCEYPCHSPQHKRWFMMRAMPLVDRSTQMFAVVHHNITRRKLAEDRADYLASHDPLTGLPNRRSFELALHHSFQDSRRDGSPISLIAVDLDNFKSYNDAHGHLAGDRYLTRAGQIILSLRRGPEQLAARIGGDEFVVLLPDTGPEQARRLAETIVQAIKESDTDVNSTAPVSVSAGVASVVARDFPPEVLLKQADAALYRAKREGRGRVSGPDSTS